MISFIKKNSFRMNDAELSVPIFISDGRTAAAERPVRVVTVSCGAADEFGFSYDIAAVEDIAGLADFIFIGVGDEFVGNFVFNGIAVCIGQGRSCVSGPKRLRDKIFFKFITNKSASDFHDDLLLVYELILSGNFSNAFLSVLFSMASVGLMSSFSALS